MVLMMIKTVLKMGEPGLLNVSEEVTEFATDELMQLIRDMQDTMIHLEGAGLAAPQIGVNKRVVIFGFDKNERYPDAEAVPYTILINPEITPLSDAIQTAEEGCLSVPGLRGMVTRYQTINYQGYDPFGEVINRNVSGFHARVVQHECDHLDGILYPMVMTDLSTLRYI